MLNSSAIFKPERDHLAPPSRSYACAPGRLRRGQHGHLQLPIEQICKHRVAVRHTKLSVSYIIGCDNCFNADLAPCSISSLAHTHIHVDYAFFNTSGDYPSARSHLHLQPITRPRRAHTAGQVGPLLTYPHPVIH